jgi:hypothetical protein
MLSSVDWRLVTDVSGQVIGPINKVQGTARLLKTGQIDCPETSVTNYQSMLRNIPEERISRNVLNYVPTQTLFVRISYVRK